MHRFTYSKYDFVLIYLLSSPYTVGITTPKLQMKEVPLIRKAIEDAKIQGFMFDELCIPQNTFC